MSQQINLLNPELRPRRDVLSLAGVAPLTLGMLLLVAVVALWLGNVQRQLDSRESELAGQVKSARERLQALSQAAGQRKGNPALAEEAQRLAAALQGRREALQLLQAGGTGMATTGFSNAMVGVARQSMDGLWLTALAVQGGELELSGRMLDPALLPTYIRRLNAETVFQGRRFAELDMKGVLQPAAGSPPAPAQGLPRYTEFTLRTSAVADKPARRGGEQ